MGYSEKHSPPKPPQKRKKEVKSQLADLDLYQSIDPARMLQVAMMSHLTFKRKRAQNIESKGSIAGYQYLDIYSDDKNEHCRIYYNEHDAVVCFEGSDLNNAYHDRRNRDIGGNVMHHFIGIPVMVPSPFGGESKVHPGFKKALFADNDVSSPELEDCFAKKVRDACLELGEDHTLSFTGNSAGGAMAIVFAGFMAAHHKDALSEDSSIYTFGSPRVGGRQFIDALQSHFDHDHFIRCEIYGDPIPGVPRYKENYYVHGGRQLVLNKGGAIIQSCEEAGKRRDSYAKPIEAYGQWARLQSGMPIKKLDTYHSTEQYMAALQQLCDQGRQSATIKTSKTALKERRQTDAVELLGKPIPALVLEWKDAYPEPLVERGVNALREMIVNPPTPKTTSHYKGFGENEIENMAFWWMTHLRAYFEEQVESEPFDSHAKADLISRFTKFKDALMNMNEQPLDKYEWLKASVKRVEEFYGVLEANQTLPNLHRTTIEYGISQLSFLLENARQINKARGKEADGRAA